MDSLVESIRAAAESIRTPNPDFDVRLGRASSFDLLLASRYEEVVQRSKLLDAAEFYGRVLISGRGGAGKTVTLEHLTKIAITRGWLAVFVDLKAWTARETNTLKLDVRSPERALQSRLFRRVVESFSRPRIRLSQLDALPPTAPKLLLLDGLNEVPEEFAEALLTGADRFAAEQVGASVIVTDRLVRRSISNEKWALFAPMPVRKDGEISSSSLLEIPFFLDAWQQSSGNNKSSRSAIIRDYFVSHSGVTSDELRALASAAYEAYEVTGSRTFDFARFQKFVPVAAGKLVEAGVLILQANDASFSHHLLHDYLAAQDVAESRTQWNREAFQVLSFKGSSFDAISLCFELIAGSAKESPSADELFDDGPGQYLRAVYDWNAYAAGYCLADASPTAVRAVKGELRTIILAMLAERTADPALPTRQRALDALALLQEQRLGADDQSAQRAREMVRREDRGSVDYLRWRELYLRTKDEAATAQDMMLLMAEDSVLGWTLANVLKRGLLSAEYQSTLRHELRHNESATLRWRAAHVLGAFPSGENLLALFAALSDSDSLVRYGIARSLVEMARRDATLRDAFLQKTKDQARNLLSDRQTLDAMANSFDIAARPADWTYFASRFARVLYEEEDDPVRGARWLEFAEKLGAGEESAISA